MRKEELQERLDDLRDVLSITLEAMLLYAGVKKEKLNEAVQDYIESIGEVLENSDKEGADEVMEVVEYLRIHKKELFN